MKLKIYPNYFAPKCADRNEKYDTRNSHCIYTIPCNFRCAFCKNGIVNESTNNEISLQDFDSTVSFLIQTGTMFKFTGGEPTLLPELTSMLKIVKKYNGCVFLDSNGSNNDIINMLIGENLIDVLGLSIKGLTAESAMKVSGVKKQLCWSNVLESIRATASSKVRLIVTFVVYSTVELEALFDFLDLLNSINPLCYFKINNLYGSIHRDSSLLPLTIMQLNTMISEILIKKPEWKNRLILVEDFDSVSNYESIKFY